MKLYRVYAALLAGILSLFSLFSCSPKAPEAYSDTFFDCFDTMSVIKGYADSQESFNRYSALFHDTLIHYHKLFDIYNEYEGIVNLRTLNLHAAEAPMEVDPDLMELLEYCVQMNDLTGGMTNIAMGSVLSIWHGYREYGRSNPEEAELPPMSDLEAAALHTDISDLILDKEASTVYFADPGLKLDVGAIAKGYATQKVSDLLKKEGFTNAAISVGGNLEVLGPQIDGRSWPIGIINPDKDAETLYVIRLGLTDYTLVTSGSYERYYTVDGVRYHHIIHPDTLMPENTFVSVSILTDDSGMADALSTALFNMSFEDGSALIASLDHTEAFWIYPDGTQKQSEGFASYVID